MLFDCVITRHAYSYLILQHINVFVKKVPFVNIRCISFWWFNTYSFNNIRTEFL